MPDDTHDIFFDRAAQRAARRAQPGGTTRLSPGGPHDELRGIQVLRVVTVHVRQRSPFEPRLTDIARLCFLKGKHDHLCPEG
jgi:hypothetical protein